jgi:hypothetical protein
VASNPFPLTTPVPSTLSDFLLREKTSDELTLKLKPFTFQRSMKGVDEERLQGLANPAELAGAVKSEKSPLSLVT